MASRVRVSFDGDPERRARRKANRLGISLDEYVRGVVASDLGKVPEPANVSSIFDLGGSAEVTDVTRDKDRMLAEAIDPRRGRR
jgi:hypothetical protein